MPQIRKWLALLLLLACLLPLVSVNAQASEETEPYIQRMIQYYEKYQEEAAEEIKLLLAYITQLDPETGALWSTIMTDWDAMGREMEVNLDVLPDGLPQDDSLCIVVLGYQLTEGGGMRSELIARLETALRSAEKYPNAYIAVTGGATGTNSASTEAGRMAKWLREHGIAGERIIVEKKARSTTENATRTYRLLKEEYPGVTSVAVISSEYHVRTGCVLLQTAATLGASQGDPEIRVVGNAGATTGKRYDALYYQTRGICDITGIPYKRNKAPDL